ncbi:hypothetical protein [Romboutsia sp.]|uniref:hypothetical protein n=1 Tax=Romboutsia sp. TaxID=1965302 RepID=UPI003F2F03B9
MTGFVKFILSTFFHSKYAGDEYIWAVKFDGEGNIIWQSAFGDVGIQSDGEWLCFSRP